MIIQNFIFSRGILLTLVVAFAVGSATSGCTKPDQANSTVPASSGSVGPQASPVPPPVPVAPQPPKPAELTVSAVDLCKDYKADPKAADAKYKGKYIEMAGIVGSAGSPGMAPGENYVVVAAVTDPTYVGFGPFIRCYVDPVDSGQCNVLSQTQTIAFRGNCLGISNAADGTMLDLKNCRVIATGKDPSRVMTAEEVAAAYARDQSAAKDEYKYGPHASKDAVIVGTIQKFEPDQNRVWLDAGKTADGKPLSVRITLASSSMPSALQHAVGQSIRIKGDLDDFRDGYLMVMAGLVLPDSAK